ncbi:MAG TPA: hypothetical protein VN914_03605 [Polyangia bacterium]|nr:hypothetical protein [Polyangia bacterium]
MSFAEPSWLERAIAGFRRLWGRLLRAVPLVGWVSYPPLLLTFAGVLAVVGGVGADLGAPSLVWHERPFIQLSSGFAAAALCLHLGLVGYLLDTRDEPPREATVGDLARYVVWPLLLLLVVAGFALPGRYGLPAHGIPVVAPALLLFLAAALSLSSRRPLAPVLGARIERRMQRHGFRSRWGHQRRIDPGAHAVQAVSMVVLALLYVLAWIFPGGTPAAGAVALALALVTGVWGFFAFWMRRYRVLGMGLLLLIAVALGVSRDVPPEGVTSASLACKPEQRRNQIGDAAALEMWKLRAGGPSPPLVVVVTSGGASRSALWTVTVLDALERRIPGFLRHVRIITGASGGMVGAAHYVSAIDPDRPAPDLAVVRKGIVADSLTAVTRALILPGLERGRALELAWEANAQRLELPFERLGDGESGGWRPSLVFTPMMVEDGRRLIISNLDLSIFTHTSNGPSICLADEPCDDSVSGVELLACPGAGLDTLRLSTVARLNATFPWVTSAALLPSRPTRRIVDAGYYDNFGVDLASLWIRKHADWIRRSTSGLLLVQIRDMQSQEERRNVLSPPGPGAVHEWYSALSTPLEGGLQARESTMSFRNDDEIGLVASHPQLAGGFVATTLFELDGQAPLSWYLSEADVKSMKAPDPATLDRVAAWFHTRAP